MKNLPDSGLLGNPWQHNVVEGAGDQLDQAENVGRSSVWREPTFEGGVDELLSVGAEQSIAEHQVQAAKQQVVWIHQVISNHTEVPFKHRNTSFRT